MARPYEQNRPLGHACLSIKLKTWLDILESLWNDAYRILCNFLYQDYWDVLAPNIVIVLEYFKLI